MVQTTMLKIVKFLPLFILFSCYKYIESKCELKKSNSNFNIVRNLKIVESNKIKLRKIVTLGNLESFIMGSNFCLCNSNIFTNIGGTLYVFDLYGNNIMVKDMGFKNRTNYYCATLKDKVFTYFGKTIFVFSCNGSELSKIDLDSEPISIASSSEEVAVGVEDKVYIFGYDGMMKNIYQLPENIVHMAFSRNFVITTEKGIFILKDRPTKIGDGIFAAELQLCFFGEEISILITSQVYPYIFNEKFFVSAISFVSDVLKPSSKTMLLLFSENKLKFAEYIDINDILVTPIQFNDIILVLSSSGYIAGFSLDGDFLFDNLIDGLDFSFPISTSYGIFAKYNDKLLLIRNGEAYSFSLPVSSPSFFNIPLLYDDIFIMHTSDGIIFLEFDRDFLTQMQVK